ncbi:Rieske (2Fe-2S) protein [Roseiarcaceae bacterium H3SJ34-1]|uniref:Rieske (2Fe-2S) protein n=1 Tax=Terripilifer ovatus TaxID=3032367 RepID=UPI003AB9882D|nr:Rieske (2Fe-2S) protein [Roseiarcaceae bacterium H3SJ34-1]
MPEYSLGTIDQFEEGKGRAFKAGGRTVAVFKSHGSFFAMANRCLHKGASMCDGELTRDGQEVRCPWHNWSFDLKSGRSPIDETEIMRTYDVKVDGGEVILVL